MILKRVLNFTIMILSVFIFCAFGYKEYRDSQRMIVYLDPGHGGIDSGCISNDEVYEKEIVLNIAYKIKEYLEYNGFKVLMTRTADYDLAKKNSINRKHDDILKRVELINNSNAVCCVSVHANAYQDKNACGAQTFYGKNDLLGEKLSDLIQNEIINTLENTKRSALKINNKYILDNVNCPISIVEVGFLSNNEECKMLQNEEYQMLIAYAIGDGIISFINETYY